MSNIAQGLKTAHEKGLSGLSLYMREHHSASKRDPKRLLGKLGALRVLLPCTQANDGTMRPHWSAVTGKRECLHDAADPISARGRRVHLHKSTPLETLRGLTTGTGS